MPAALSGPAHMEAAAGHGCSTGQRIGLERRWVAVAVSAIHIASYVTGRGVRAEGWRRGKGRERGEGMEKQAD